MIITQERDVVSTEIVVQEDNRRAPWLGIGVQGEWDDYREALAAAGLDFNVRQEQLFWNRQAKPGVVFEEQVEMFANVRDTDDETLGLVSPNYGIIQNEDAFRLLQPFTEAGGIITNAGMTQQGLCFMVLRMRNKDVLGDAYDFDVMCCNSFNTKFPLSLMMVPLRIICQNMYRQLMGKNDGLLHLRHGSNADDRLKAASLAMAAVTSYISAFDLTLQQAYSHALSDKQVANTVALLFPYPKPGGPREENSRERVDAKREEFMTRYYDAPDNQRFHNTGMGVINAYYDYISHRDPGKNMPGEWEHRRLSGIVAGNGIKTNVIQKVI